MKATIGHIGINLSTLESLGFWRALLGHLGFSITDDGDHFDASDGRAYLCVAITSAGYERAGFHRKRTGLNHIAFNVSSPGHVHDFVTNFLEARGIESMYGGPRPYPEYTGSYFAVYFEDPDRIKVEIVYDPADPPS